ncbi:hypothetical protein XPA_009840 [Xanthoria parietina]
MLELGDGLEQPRESNQRDADGFIYPVLDYIFLNILHPESAHPAITAGLRIETAQKGSLLINQLHTQGQSAVLPSHVPSGALPRDSVFIETKGTSL